WLDKVEKVVALYNDFHGIDKNLEDITRKDIQSFIYKLKYYPANAALRFPNKSFQEVLKANEIEDYPCLNYKTIKDGYLTTLAALFNYALGLGCVDNIPTYKVMVPGKKQYRVSKDEPFEIDELNRIFKQPIYTGFKSMARRYTPGNKITRDHIYWVPIIALYTGMRCTEIACIKTADIDLETSYPHLSIIGTKENPFKTSNAQRRIPLVKALDKLGFFEFIRNAKKQGHVRLFEDWKPLKIKYSNTAFIKRFNDRIVPVVLGGRYDPKNENYDPTATRPKSFHALRKNFKTLLIHGKVNQAVADQIIGHAQSAIDKRYVGKVQVKNLYEEVKDLDYEGLDLGHLL
ncbi:MAG TPA: hypothetical protein ENK52_01250, partial [Saprospiraceae bacterium]|nr:hypothetical protein [Saprospiraceae bacterium]